MKELILYRCEICGNLICMIEDSGVVPVCCGAEMTRVSANTADAGPEKHVPVSRRAGNSVQVMVGEVPHPMTLSHYISFILLLTNRGAYIRWLQPGDAAEAVFFVHVDEDVVSVYAWCNLHGLWKS